MIVIRRGSNQLTLYNGAKRRAAVQGRDRAVDLPDAARQVPDRRQVEEPVVVPAGARRGRRARSRSRPGPATRSARAGWASRRRASASTARPTPARSATRASHGCIRMLDPAGRVAVRPRRRRHAGLHRRCMMRDACQAHRPGRRARRGGRSARPARLEADAPVARRRRSAARRRAFTLKRARRRPARSRSRRCAASRWSSTSGRRGAGRARPRRRRSRRRGSSTSSQGVVVHRHRRPRLHGRRAHVPRARTASRTRPCRTARARSLDR